MNPLGQTICLSMIVKDEAPVIRRCLESVKPIIDHWIIVDTGSSDGTQQIIQDFMADKPGTLYERKWRDFAHNRTEALKLSRNKADFSLIIDADDFLVVPKDYQLPFLIEDGYTLNILDGGLIYPRTQIVHNKIDWFYRGVLHEFITSNEPHKIGALPLQMVRNHDGARRRDPLTYHRDAEIFEKALLTEKDDYLRRRYAFYLAQSYRDNGNLPKALEAYRQRATMGGWTEEVYCSLYQAGKIQERLNHPVEEVLQTFDAAIQVAPMRVEARYAASRLCRNNKRFQQGYDYARPGLNLPFQNGCLFGEPWVNDYGLLDEFAVNAYWIGRFQDSLEACLRILATERLPASEYQRVVKNASEAARELRARSNVPGP